MRREGQARGAGKDSGAQRRRARSMDMARHGKREQKTEYGYKRRCGGKDRRGVQEKTAARSADARDQWTWLDTGKENKKLNMDISADAAGRTGAGCRKRQRRRGADARDQWTRLDTGKENKKSKRKTEYGYKRAARAKSEAGRIGRRWRREQLPKQNLF